MTTEVDVPIVNYEQLEALEDEFEEIELEMSTLRRHCYLQTTSD